MASRRGENMAGYNYSLGSGLARSFTELFGLGTNEYQRQFNSAEAEKQRNFEAQQAELNRNFQEMQRTTQYQTAVKDMEKAGLNPAMMFSGSGSAASPTSGSMAHGSTANSGATNLNGLGQIASLINSAANVAHVMNNDKSKKNNMSVYDTVKLINTVAKLF